MDTNKTEETSFHDAYVTSKEVRAAEAKFYSEAARQKEYGIFFDFLGDLTGRTLLFYGSGGHFSLLRRFAELGANVVAIDISPETVAKVGAAITSCGLQERCSARVMDCEYLEFADHSFDVVFARSIIHHLDVDRSLKEIARVLKPGGKFTVLEPLGTNPMINCYRRLTPGSRTSGEHPLLPEDLKKFELLFTRTSYHYLYFLSILSYFFRMVDGSETRFNRIFQLLCRLDSLLVNLLPKYRYLCWDVLLCCER